MGIITNAWLVASCLQLAVTAARPFVPGGTVSTSSGWVKGGAAQNRTQVSQYLGIPFAVPPVGDLRWTAPQAYTGKGVISATKFSPDCPANVGSIAGLANSPDLVGPNAVRIGNALGQVGTTQGEDCLTLNIWTKPQTGEKAKAVLFWIYGGAFSTGNTANPIYDGEYLAEDEDVVVVSANYRINIFGFPGLPGLDQNLGLLDQRLAIEWVQKNIAAFGGDPKRITIFGQSAGGASVDYYSYAWASNPIVAGFIEMSGTATSFLSYSGSTTNNTAQWYNATEKLGCGGPEAGINKTVACARTKSFQDVLKASSTGMFAATIDEKVIFSDYPGRASAGLFTKKPYLIGNTDYEAGIFKIGLDLPDAQWDIANLISFTCPAANAAKARAANSVPVWRYRWFGEFPNTRLTLNPSSGAWHGGDLPIVFGTAESVTQTPNTPAEVAITKYFKGAWAAFAKNPSKGLSAAPYNWPTYNPQGDTLVRLGYNNESTASYVSPLEFDAGCAQLGQ